MFRKKEVASFPDQSEVVSAVLMPHAQKSDEQMIQWLADHGVYDVKKLANRFLSVRASRKTLKEAEAVARVEIKLKSKLHRPERSLAKLS